MLMFIMADETSGTIVIQLKTDRQLIFAVEGEMNRFQRMIC